MGPSCSSTTIEETMVNGVDVFRINFFMLTIRNRKTISTIRLLNKNNIYTSILADLQGPKLRIGNVEEAVNIAKDEVLEFV